MRLNFLWSLQNLIVDQSETVTLLREKNDISQLKQQIIVFQIAVLTKAPLVNHVESFTADP